MGTTARVVYNTLVRTAPLARHRAAAALWHRAWDRAGASFSGPVRTTIHGQPALVNFGHTYPAFSRRYPRYNAPLVDLVHRSFAAAGRPVTVVDVGASVGDTVLLLDAKCAGEVSSYHCVDGDAEFFAYLTTNLGRRADCALYEALLSAGDIDAPALVRTHGGTASAQGTAVLRAQPLDDVLAAAADTIDVLKVDTDGFDGRVLRGAQDILHKSRPGVIFEWHPLLYERTGNDPFEPFEVLDDAGYQRLTWHTKFGDFSHASAAVDRRLISVLRDRCLAEPALDMHYDVVADRPAAR